MLAFDENALHKLRLRKQEKRTREVYAHIRIIIDDMLIYRSSVWNKRLIINEQLIYYLNPDLKLPPWRGGRALELQLSRGLHWLKLRSTRCIHARKAKGEQPDQEQRDPVLQVITLRGGLGNTTTDDVDVTETLNMSLNGWLTQ
ncbi:hypothetical protein T265_15670, partial [Opisthorchis viverrini]